MKTALELLLLHMTFPVHLYKRLMNWLTDILPINSFEKRHISASPVPNNSVETVGRGLLKEEPWEAEVDDLVDWSSKLDTNFVDT